MDAVTPILDPALVAIAPGFRAVSITLISEEPIIHPEVGEQALKEACQAMLTEDVPWAQAHLDAWAVVFRKFGAKPQRTPCSAEALRKRVVRDGSLPNIDPVVDLYNAISIRYAIPVGGENLARYQGAPQLTIAEGTELFDTIKEGQSANETVDKGEVIWRDDLGVTCRRWNWRQGVRTRLDASARQMWFVLESLPEMPLSAVQQATDELIAGLRKMLPNAHIQQVMVEVPSA